MPQFRTFLGGIFVLSFGSYALLRAAEQRRLAELILIVRTWPAFLGQTLAQDTLSLASVSIARAGIFGEN
jgi:hypothetical protein